MGILNFIKKITGMVGMTENVKDKQVDNEKDKKDKKIAFSDVRNVPPLGALHFGASKNPPTNIKGFSDIENWIENKKKETELQEKKVFVLIQERIKNFSKGLEEKIKILNSVNLESRKAEEKIKSVVEEGKKKYIEFIEILIKRLNNLQEDQLEKVLEEINNNFLEFNKHSHMSYEKATIFIGKEMNDIKEELVIFSRDLLKISENNKEIINYSKWISLIKLKLKQLDEIEMDIDKINALMLQLDKKTTNKLEENKMLLKEIEIAKKSPDYLEHLDKKEKIKLAREDLEKDFMSLKQLIDFKSLANFYHMFENKMQILNSYKDNFQEEFQKDGGKDILNLLNEAKLNNSEISNKISQLNRKKEELEEMEMGKNKDKTQEIESKIININLEIANLKNSKAKEEKKSEKLNINKEEIVKEIKEEFVKMGMELD